MDDRVQFPVMGKSDGSKNGERIKIIPPRSPPPPPPPPHFREIDTVILEYMEYWNTIGILKEKMKYMKHCGKKIKKAAVKEEEKTKTVRHYEKDKSSKRKVFFERKEERREWYEISTREEQESGKQ